MTLQHKVGQKSVAYSGQSIPRFANSSEYLHWAELKPDACKANEIWYSSCLYRQRLPWWWQMAYTFVLSLFVTSCCHYLNGCAKCENDQYHICHYRRPLEYLTLPCFLSSFSLFLRSAAVSFVSCTAYESHWRSAMFLGCLYAQSLLWWFVKA